MPRKNEAEEKNKRIRVRAEELLGKVEHIPEIAALYFGAMTADHDELARHAHQIALLVLVDRASRAVLAYELVVGLTQRTRPLIGVASVGVGRDAGVTHERHVALVLVEAPEGARVAEEVLALRARAVVGALRVAAQAQRARIRLQRVVVVVERARYARAAEVLAGHLGHMAIGHVELLDGDQVVDGHVPAGHVAERRAARSLCAQIPQVGGQVGALDHRHGVVHRLLRHCAVVLGGERLKAKIATKI